MCISYGATLALEIATTARRLIESPHQTRPSQLPPEERRVYIADLLARAREAIDRQRVIEAESQEVERPASDGAASNPKPR
jgi:hypothetical protein